MEGRGGAWDSRMPEFRRPTASAGRATHHLCHVSQAALPPRATHPSPDNGHRCLAPQPNFLVPYPTRHRLPPLRT